MRLKNSIYNISFALNCLLLFLLVFGHTINLPVFLKVAGRMHPMVLHFPIVLLILAFVWELTIGLKKEPVIREAGEWLLLSASFTAVIAALMGFFLSREEGYDPDSIAWHKWTGVVISLLALCWYGFKDIIRRRKAMSATVGALCTVAIVMAGHQGANITHGEDFLLAPMGPSSLQPTVLFEDAVAYTHLIQPILEAKCISCHSSAKAKGELVMDTKELLLKGGKSGKLWDSTATGFGLLMQRLHLPLDEKKHMPPKGKPQLTEEETNALYYWIRGGANFTAKITDLPVTDSLKIIATSFFKTVEGDNYAFAAADEATIKELNNDYRVVSPLAIGSPALGVEFYGASFYKGEQLKELEAVKDQVVTLNLNKMPVKDEDLKYIGSMQHLRKLNLSFTQVTGAGLKELAKLKNLRQLSLSGTTVKSADLSALKQLPKLAALYIWNTSINNNEMAAVQQQFPKLSIGTGFRGDTIVVKLNNPVIEGEKQVFTNSTGVHLKNYIRGAVMRYTLDDTEPDSINSTIYKDSIIITRTSRLKARAFLKGWISSDVASKDYFKAGFLADSVQLLVAPNKDYPGLGAKTLTNGQKGDLNFRSEKWLGYTGDALSAILYFNKPVLLSSVTFSSLVNAGGYIMPPAELEVWGAGKDGKMTLLKKLAPAQPDSLKEPSLASYACNFSPKEIATLKIIAKPIMKLPNWHPGKGKPAWVFIDELFLN